MTQTFLHSSSVRPVLFHKLPHIGVWAGLGEVNGIVVVAGDKINVLTQPLSPTLVVLFHVSVAEEDIPVAPE